MMLKEDDAKVGVLQQRALAYLKKHRVSIAAQLRVYRYLQETRDVHRRRQYFDKLSRQMLPSHLRQHLCEELWGARLMSLGLVLQLVHWDDAFLKQLVLSIVEEVLPSQSIVYNFGETSVAAYKVLKGKVMFMIPQGHSRTNAKCAPYTDGMWIGEKALVNSDLQRCETAVCEMRTDLMVVPAAAFWSLVADFGFTEQYESMLRKKLWVGLCGRCGALGDHFTQECQLLLPRKHNYTQHIWSRFNPFIPSHSTRSKRSSQGSSEKQSVSLHRYLRENRLESISAILEEHGVHDLEDLTRETIQNILEQDKESLSPEEAHILSAKCIKDFETRVDRAVDDLLKKSEGDHLAFISHYKLEAGTEAALMHRDLERMIRQDSTNQGHGLKSPIFLDSEDLDDLDTLTEHVRRSHNLIVLLTKGVLTRPWVLIEVITAYRHKIRMVPVEVIRPGQAFEYPTDKYFEELAKGQELDASAKQLLSRNGFDLDELTSALRQVFTMVAVPFSPHRSASIRQAELLDILKRCRIRAGNQLRRANTSFDGQRS